MDAASTARADAPALTVLAPDAGAGAAGGRLPLLRLLRPQQWIKNLFVLAPVIFAGLFADGPQVARALAAVLAFCAASSAVYVANDLLDLERDRAHPVKRFSRPLAAGTVSPSAAKGVLALLGLVLLGVAVAWPRVGAVLVAYLAVNAAYSLRLKHVAIVDLFCIATGFVLRVLAGAVAVRVPLSSWMLVTTLCLALYLAALKRRTELATRGSAGRSVLDSYSVALLDRYAEMSAVGALLFYGLFILQVRPELVVTMPLVLFGIFRYWFLVERRGAGEAPSETLWTDVPLALTVAAWAVVCMYALRYPGSALLPF